MEPTRTYRYQHRFVRGNDHASPAKVYDLKEGGIHELKEVVFHSGKPCLALRLALRTPFIELSISRQEKQSCCERNRGTVISNRSNRRLRVAAS